MEALQVGLLCLVLLGIRSPGASALVTEDLQHDISETGIPSVPLGMATLPLWPMFACISLSTCMPRVYVCVMRQRLVSRSDANSNETPSRVIEGQGR